MLTANVSRKVLQSYSRRASVRSYANARCNCNYSGKFTPNFRSTKILGCMGREVMAQVGRFPALYQAKCVLFGPHKYIRCRYQGVRCSNEYKYSTHSYLVNK